MSARVAHAGEFALSIGLIALGSFIIFETQGIAEAQSYSGVGPRLFPYLIGVGLTLCGAVLGWQAVSGGWRHVPIDDNHATPDWISFGVISAGIVLHMIVIGWAGFILASTLLFVLIARGFGSKRPVRDVLIAVVLATVVFVVFTKGLGLNLPKGPFDAIF
jgi:putative tricarboxylic transport membrane protein